MTKTQSIFSLLIILLLINPASAATREESILHFVDETRVSDQGFAETVQGSLNLESTVKAMQIKSILREAINNSLDILYYFQTLQDSSGGFSPVVGDPPSLNSTISAVKGLQYLDINQSQFIQWQIFPFLNSSAQQILLTNTNGTRIISNLTIQHLQLWKEFIVTSSLLGTVPNFPVLELIDRVKNLQYANGSYINLEFALSSINLLSVLGEVPNDQDLAKKFILSFRATNGAFSRSQDGDSSLDITHRSLETLDLLMDLWQLEDRTEISRFVFAQQRSRSGFAEIGSPSVTITSTLDAILILSYLDDLSELNAPDVLQEVGFVNFPLVAVIIILPVLAIYHCNNIRRGN